MFQHKHKTLNLTSTVSLLITKPILMVGFAISVLVCSVAIAAADVSKGYQAKGDPLTDRVALLSRFGELIARERAFGRIISGLSLSDPPFAVDGSMLSAVLGDDFYTLYDEILPKLEELGQQSRRDELAIRFKPEAQQQLVAGKRVEGINEGAVNNIIAHYKIAIEKLDTSVRQLLLAESHLIRRSGDELTQAFNESGETVDYVSYVRASQLLSAVRQIKGFVQPRCKAESDAIKQSRTLLNGVDEKFYFDEKKKFQTSVQAIYDAAGLVEAQAILLSEDGSHCK